MTKLISLHGPESVGKTVLAERLAAHFGAPLIPEYGRTYCEENGTELDAADLVKIGQTHHLMTLAALPSADHFLFLDTDPLMTTVWSDMMLGDQAGYQRDQWFGTFNDYADLYLLLDIDLPFIDDGLRIYGDEGQRRRFFEMCRQELIQREVRWELISGTGEARFEAALKAIRSLG